MSFQASRPLTLPAEMMDLPPAYQTTIRRSQAGPSERVVLAGSSDDGRFEFLPSEDGDMFSQLLSGRTGDTIEDVTARKESLPDHASGTATSFCAKVPSLNIVIQIVGSRGDVQPLLALGLRLQEHGHRVRIATHAIFEEYVLGFGLEFFSIGGEPEELMAYMVKNSGLVPSMQSLQQGDIGRHRQMMRSIMDGCWRSCHETGDGVVSSSSIAGQYMQHIPFVADAIIANPPSFAHIHCAEKLGLPLHLVFTMPWSPTQAYPHPLAKPRYSSNFRKANNFLSYLFMDALQWQGLGDIINSFRVKTLGLDRVDPAWAAGIISELRIPYSYCWPTCLASKPADWGSHLEVTGCLSLPEGPASTFQPPRDLIEFLEAGAAPIYVGFGSIVVGRPRELTQIVFDAIKIAGVRAIVSRGWSGIGHEGETFSEDIFLVNDCPHQWLYKHVACVVHHGGAGTTATGLSAGKPTVIVPFFGDQFFWGDLVHRAGAGPEPIPARLLEPASLAAAIKEALEEAVTNRAREIGTRINEEQGAENAVRHIHQQLPTTVRPCELLDSRPGVWLHKGTGILLCAMAAAILHDERRISYRDLQLYRTCEFDLARGPWEPVSGALLSVASLFYESFSGMGEVLFGIIKVPAVIFQKTKAVRAMGQATSSHAGLGPLRNQQGISSAPYLPNRQHIVADLISATVKPPVKGALRIAKAAARAPGNFTLALAQGSHNLPKAWGDRSVRPLEKVEGLRSGIFEGTKELFLGVYDGVTGLVTQPYNGAIEQGVPGLVKGIGKGVVGVPVKFFAAASGVVGLPLKGVDVSVTKCLVGHIDRKIRSARINQGHVEGAAASELDKTAVLIRWHALSSRSELGGNHVHAVD